MLNHHPRMPLGLRLVEIYCQALLNKLILPNGAPLTISQSSWHESHDGSINTKSETVRSTAHELVRNVQKVNVVAKVKWFELGSAEK
jgi:hypothetical protein